MEAFFKHFRRFPVVIIGVALVAVLAGFVGVSALTAKTPQASVAENTCGAHCVEILPSGFSKTELAVTVGSTVEFRSADGRSHNLALGRGSEHSDGKEHADSSAPAHHDHVSGTESGVFGPDEAWRVQFKQVGSYLIHDHANPDFTILVVVYLTNDRSSNLIMTYPALIAVVEPTWLLVSTPINIP